MTMSDKREHICQRCGAKQERHGKYKRDPRFVVEKMDEREGDGIESRQVVAATIAVDLQEYFKCEVCGNVVNFDENLVKTDIEASGEVPAGSHATLESAERDILREVRSNHDVEDYL